MHVLHVIAALPILVFAKIRPGTLPESFVEPLVNPPPWQIHEYNDNTYILRQSGVTESEKPFLYLLFGEEKVFLLDTGSGDGRPSSAIADTIKRYMRRRSYSGDHEELRKRAAQGHSSIDLIVGHSHSHDDHIDGDSDILYFTSPYVRKTTVISPFNITALKSAYSIAHWPTSEGSLDLGKRILDIIPLPGHNPESIAIYDRQTGLLLTGDSVYPGRLYIPVNATRTFKASHSKLEAWIVGKEVSWVLGCHIEQKRTPFEDYPAGTHRQPHEHDLQLNVSVLRDVGLAAANSTPNSSPSQGGQERAVRPELGLGIESGIPSLPASLTGTVTAQPTMKDPLIRLVKEKFDDIGKEVIASRKAQQLLKMKLEWLKKQYNALKEEVGPAQQCVSESFGLLLEWESIGRRLQMREGRLGYLEALRQLSLMDENDERIAEIHAVMARAEGQIGSQQSHGYTLTSPEFAEEWVTEAIAEDTMDMLRKMGELGDEEGGADDEDDAAYAAGVNAFLAAVEDDIREPVDF
ncbi:hypothetical protein EJ08DRAFT_699285 [Tothia fuscella]|uniref:Metallo-beta-lactamase domain-containing protein n=1 Tax=Tothia fuscella TaxID=1048955 RepID=A0A9P4NMW8_9PEZI|nr:hypothetical protein EJ08DRAFT_699285 [Tothia fuscella]